MPHFLSVLEQEGNILATVIPSLEPFFSFFLSFSPSLQFNDTCANIVPTKRKNDASGRAAFATRRGQHASSRAETMSQISTPPQGKQGRGNLVRKDGDSIGSPYIACFLGLKSTAQQCSEQEVHGPGITPYTIYVKNQMGPQSDKCLYCLAVREYGL